MNGTEMNGEEPFQISKITDLKTGKTVCPGILRPLVLLDSDPNIQELIKDSIGYTPIHRGIPLRIFWDDYHQRFNFSAETSIYPNPVILLNGQEGLDTSSVNLANLDKTKCYYVYVEDRSNRIVLDLETEVENPTLGLPPFRIEDINPNFTFNTRLYPIADKERLAKTQQYYDGYTYYFADGHMVEVRTPDYHAWQTLRKPAHIGFQTFYRQLQKEGHVDDYLYHFPEHNYIFMHLKKNN